VADRPERDTVNVRLPKALIEQVRAIARLHDRSLSAELRVGLADYVRRAQREEQDEANAP
jgi:predicted transcriptional regulator